VIVLPARLPRTAEYIASLPRALESFPGCEIRSTVFEAHVRDFGRYASEPGLPGPVADLLAGRLASTTWVPEVVFLSAYLVTRDLAFSDDAAFHGWMLRANQEMFERPLVRTLMRVLSPGLVVLGAAKRWSTFHRGTTLEYRAVTATPGGRTECELDLSHPPGLFPPLFLVGIQQAFLAALIAARAREPRIELSAATPEKTTYVGSFRT
jgi:hypothetical protein